jgi:hypothetical protein
MRMLIFLVLFAALIMVSTSVYSTSARGTNFSALSSIDFSKASMFFFIFSQGLMTQMSPMKGFVLKGVCGFFHYPILSA